MGSTKVVEQPLLQTKNGHSIMISTTNTAITNTNATTTMIINNASTTNAINANAAMNNKGYGKIILTLRNQLLPEDKLGTTPSQIDGLDADTETDLRIYGCELIQTAGILLKLPQVAMATGQVLLQRFYYSKSLVRHQVEHTAMACVCLASKIEEAPRRVRDVINVFMHIRQVESNKPITPVILDQNYIQLKNQVIKAERRVLKELGFCVHIKHPHKIIVMYLQVLCLEKNANLMQYSWNYMNDSLRTDVFVRYQPETVACACIYLTARKLRLPLPKNPSWFQMFGVREPDIRDVCVRILKLYTRPKPNADALGKKVSDLCRKFHEAKMRARGNSGNTTPSNNNSPNSPGSVGGHGGSNANHHHQQQQKTTGAHNAWGGFISRSGSHVAPAVITNNSNNSENNGGGKRSRSRSSSGGGGGGVGGAGGGGRSPSRGETVTSSTTRGHHHREKRNKKHHAARSRSRTPPPPSRSSKKSSHKSRRYSYSRSRSSSPRNNRKNRDKRKSSRSPSYDRENRNDRYVDRYDKYSKDDTTTSSKDRYDSGGGGGNKRYDRDSKGNRYSSSGGTRKSGSGGGGKHGSSGGGNNRDDDKESGDYIKDERSKDRRR